MAAVLLPPTALSEELHFPESPPCSNHGSAIPHKATSQGKDTFNTPLITAIGLLPGRRWGGGGGGLLPGRRWGGGWVVTCKVGGWVVTCKEVGGWVVTCKEAGGGGLLPVRRWGGGLLPVMR